MTFVTAQDQNLTPFAALRRLPYLKSLPDETIHRLGGAAKQRHLIRGQMLITEGQRCAELIVVVTGAVKVYKLDSRGREITLDRETPGQSVLDVALFDGGNYPANVEAAEDSTCVLLVPRNALDEVMVAYPKVAVLALKSLGKRMRKLIVTVEAQSLYSVRARLARYLLERAEGNVTLTLTETNEQIGAHIGTVREVVSRSLHSFKDAGAITLSGRNITFTDTDLIRRIAATDDNTTNIT